MRLKTEFPKAILKHLSTFFLVVVVITFLSACKKESTEDSSTEKGITEEELTSSNSFTQRIWFMFLAEAKYYSASGALDSTYTFSPADQQLRFSKDGSGAVNKAYSIFSSGGVISRFWPGVGEWSLSNNGKTLTVMQTSLFPEPGKPGGAYSVSYNPAAPGPFPYNKSLGLKRTELLSGGRKAEITFLLGSNP